MSEPMEQDEWTALEEQLREALQHQRAAYEQLQERQREVDEVMERARALLARHAARAALARQAEP